MVENKTDAYWPKKAACITAHAVQAHRGSPQAGGGRPDRASRQSRTVQVDRRIPEYDAKRGQRRGDQT